MVDNLSKAFERGTEKYLDMISSSDDEIAIEYSNAETEKNFKGNKLEEYSNVSSNSRRKPMLAAQPDKKRERSVSEFSENSRHSFEPTEKIITSSNKIEKVLRKQKKALKSKNSKITKKQNGASKVEKSEKETKKDKYGSKKDKLENKKEKTLNKKSLKVNKTKMKKSIKKGKKKSPVRSRSNSRSTYRSPSRSDVSSTPISWPPSSPDERFNFNPQEHSRKRSLQNFNDSKDSFIGKSEVFPSLISTLLMIQLH